MNQQVGLNSFKIIDYVNNEAPSSNLDQRQRSNSQPEIVQNQEIAHVSCGAEHSFALTTSGELYSWGLNFRGQLGHGDLENRSRPTLVKNLSLSYLESGQYENELRILNEDSKRPGVREGSGSR